MKIIFKIARTELACLFYSVTAWVVFILFSIETAFLFTGSLHDLTVDQHEGFALRKLTKLLYTNLDPSAAWPGLLPAVQQSLYLYIPLLTMGLVSRELNSGSVKLLQSSPLKTWQIIAGKFLAIVVYGLLLMALLLVFVGVGALAVASLDILHVLSGLLGLLLLLCTYAAIGLFMSCLGIYQVIAAISTLVMIAAFSYISELFQGIPLLGDIMYELGMNNRMEQFMNGLISSKNIVYFLGLTALFLGCAVLKLENMKSPKPFFRAAGAYTCCILCCLLLLHLSSLPRFTAYVDMTAGQEQTVSKETEGILGRLDEPLIVHTYVNILDKFSYFFTPNKEHKDNDFFEPYRRFQPDLKMTYTFYYDSTSDGYLYKNHPGMSLEQIARKEAPLRGFDFGSLLSPAQIRRTFNPAAEDFNVVRKICAGDRSCYLRFFSDIIRVPREKEIASAMKTLIRPSPVIGFISDHLCRQTNGKNGKTYRVLSCQPDYRYSLINEGFTVKALSLGQEEIPSGLAALVIADPQLPFTPDELARLQAYIRDGGNLLIAGEPGRQAIINPVLEMIGISLKADTLRQVNRDFDSDFVKSRLASAAESIFPDEAAWPGKDNTVTTAGAAGIAYKPVPGYTVLPLLIADSSVVGVTVTRRSGNRQQRMVVLGDADLFSRTELVRRNAGKSSNQYLASSIFSWFTDGQFPVIIPLSEGNDKALRITEEGATWTSCCLLGIVPALFLVFAIFLLVHRRRQ